MQTAKRFTGISQAMKQGAAVWLACALAACAGALCLGLAPAASASQAMPSSSPAVLQASGDAALGEVMSSGFSGIITPMAASTDISWYVGHESATSYTLKTASQMNGLASIVNGTAVASDGSMVQSDFTGKTIALANNISFINAEIVPIGNASMGAYFNGTFDGSGKTISYYKITTQTNLGIGLFGLTGPNSTIKNINVRNATISVSLPKTSTKVIEGVGSIVGIGAGSLENCTSNATITISTLVPTTQSNPSTARFMGGLAGYLAGNLVDCSFSGKISATSPADAYDDDNNKVLACIGGVVGSQGGSEVGAGNHGNISGCSNTGSIAIATTGAGGKDRFGETVDSHSVDIGGIAGYSIGNISSCSNSGAIYAPAGDTVGGIVGAWRCESLTGLADDETDIGMLPGADELVLSGCQDMAAVAKDDTRGQLSTAAIVGLHAVGGIAGAAGSHTTIIDSFNTAIIASCRWNKPSTAGIAGQSYGNIKYCYNTAEIWVCKFNADKAVNNWVLGAGYYSGGIVGMAITYRNEYNEATSPLPQIYACYNTGFIRAAGAYRQGAIAGANDGYLRDCVYLAGCTPNMTATNAVGSKEEDSYGHDENNSSLEAKAIRSSTGIAVVNTLAYSDDWNYYYVYDSSSINNGYPLLVRQSTKTDQVSLASGTVVATLAANASYSPTKAPAPSLSVTLDGTKLVENVDYRVVPQTSATAISIGSTPYTATIEGIGNYKDRPSKSVSYGIGKADFSLCTVMASPVTVQTDPNSATLAWANVNPDKTSTVTVIDSAGNTVDTGSYSAVFNNTNLSSDGNAVDPAFSYRGKYQVVATANSDSNYSGTCTNDKGFRVLRADIYTACTLTGVTYNGKLYAWDKGAQKLTEELDIPYTGSRVAPKIASLTYQGKELEAGTDYKIVFGNANPETNQDDVAGSCIAVGTENVMTIRYTNTSNFSNWINIYFNIVAADVSNPDICTIAAGAQQYTGKALTPVVVTQKVDDGTGAKTLVAGTDYTIAYSSNTNPGIAYYTVTGISPNYTGTVNGWFRIYDDTTSVILATQSGKGQPIEKGIVAKSDLAKTAQTTKIGYLAFDSNAWSVFATDSYATLDSVLANAGISAWKSADEIRFATDGSSSFSTSVPCATLAQSRYFFGATTSAATDASSPVQVVPALAIKTASGAIATTADAELASLSPSDVGDGKGVSFYYGLTAAEYASAASAGSAVSSARFIDNVTMLCVYSKEDLSNAKLSGLDSAYNEHIGDSLDLSGDLVVTDLNGNKLAYGTDYTLSYSPVAAPSSETDEEVTVTVDAAPNSAYYTGSKSIKTTVHGIPASWTRLSGDTRYDTMSKIVATGFTGSCDNVVVATGVNFPDALAASALAGKLGAPVVLTASDKLSDQAKEAIESLGAKNVYIIGGTKAVSDAAEKSIRDIFSVDNVYRYAGSTRYETALFVYTEDCSKAGAPWSDTCIITTGGKFADALSAAPYAYATCSPIFLANGDTGLLDDATASAIMSGGFKNAIIIGGTAAVSDKVKSQLGSSISFKRIGGGNRYQTSALFAAFAVGQGTLSYDSIGAATGQDFPDALAGGSLCGAKKGVLLLMDTDEAKYADCRYCIGQVIAPNKLAVMQGYIFGGTNAFSTELEKQVKAACSN